MKILVTGATGLVGREIGKALVREGHSIVAVSRSRAKAELELPYPAEVIEGDLAQAPLNDELLKSIDGVIHLLGEGVADSRWSAERKTKIMESRRIGTQNLWKSLQNHAPKVFVSASAIGYYGERGDEDLSEASTKGEGFLSDVCDEWEKAALQPENSIFQSTRKVSLRIAVVLSPQGGALAKLIPIYQAGVGGALGNGQAWMSWIHIEDLVQMFLWALKTEKVEGIINASTLQPARNLDFTKALVTALDTWQGPPTPKLAVKALYGEMSEVVLASQKVNSTRAIGLGFQFAHPELQPAMNDVCQYHRGGYQVLFGAQYLGFKKEDVFPFFSNAQNLEKITPPLLKFSVTNMSTTTMGTGTLIDYDLKIRGVPAKWRTLIKDWNPPHEFVDTQLKGPYSYWHHRHLFEDLGSGVLTRDIVQFKVPLGVLGQLVAGSFVRRDVEKIFDYRRTYLQDLARQGVQAFHR